jgi:hypothetical protein
MSERDLTRQERDWGILYERISKLLQQFGKVDAIGEGDYWLIDENWGFDQHKVEVQNLNLLDPKIVKSLQTLLGGFPDWEIMIAVALPGTEGIWPAMGLVIRRDEIIDGLQRQYFPKEFQNVRYEGSRPGTDRD